MNLHGRPLRILARGQVLPVDRRSGKIVRIDKDVCGRPQFVEH